MTSSTVSLMTPLTILSPCGVMVFITPGLRGRGRGGRGGWGEGERGEQRELYVKKHQHVEFQIIGSRVIRFPFSVTVSNLAFTCYTATFPLIKISPTIQLTSPPIAIQCL